MFADALDEVKRSNLGKAAKLNALTLLDMAHADNGHVMITWSELAELWGIAVGTSRRYLGDLQTAGVLHYSTNGDGQTVYINFKAWVRTRVGARKTSTETTENAREDDEKRAPTRVSGIDDSADDQKTRVGARKTSTETTENARGRALEASDLTRASAPDLTDRLTDYDPTGHISQSVTAEQYRRTKALLRDIHIDGPDAHRIARAHPFERVRDCIAAWWMNRKSVGGKLQNGPGIVIFWLDNWPDKPPNHFEPADWRKEELYLRHRTPAEVAAAEDGDDGSEAERRRKYIPDDFSEIAIG